MAVLPLTEVLKQVPDFRSRHGRRYPLEAILSLGVAAMLCGYNTYGAMAQWGKNYGEELAAGLGFKSGRTPSVGTLFTVFSQVDKEALNRVLFDWNEQVLSELQGSKPVLRATSVDGKVLRGSAKQCAQENALQAHFSASIHISCLPCVMNWD